MSATANDRPAIADADLERTLPGLLVLRAREHPDRAAFRHKQLGIWRPVSWRAYDANVRAMAFALADLGVRRGESVAILADNRPEWLYADLGAQAIGARSVGIYNTSPAPDVEYILEHSESRVLVCEDQEQLDKALAISTTPALSHIVIIDPRGTRSVRDSRLMTWQHLIEHGAALRDANGDWYEEQLATIDPATPAMIVYTSGTTGSPKGAMLSSDNVQMQALAARAAGFTADDTVLSYLPLCHVAEKFYSVFQHLSVGSLVHFGESIDTVQQDLREVSPTVFLGVPRIWEKMHSSVTVRMKDASWLKRTLYESWMRRGAAIAERRLAGRLSLLDRVMWRIGDLLVYRPLQERLGLRRCRSAWSGAAPIAPDLLRWFHAFGVPLVEGYGQTECSCVSHLNPQQGARLGTVGQPVAGIDCRLADDGEVLLRGRSVFVGYLKNEEATRAAIDEDGWLHTGDLGSLDEDGFLTITGRKRGIIITSGGKNISPEKVENALKLSPHVKEAVALGDGRHFIAALVQIDGDHVGDWAARRGITYTSYEDLTRLDEVRRLIAEAVHTANEHLAAVEQVKEFRLLPRELNQDEGELTPTRKVRRRQVHAAFADLIADAYGGR